MPSAIDADPKRVGAIFEVGRILSDRIRNGVQQYKIRWAGFGSEEDSWEPLKNLGGAAEMVKKYAEEKKPGASRSRSRGRPRKIEETTPKLDETKPKSKSSSRSRVSARSSSRSRARSKSLNKSKTKSAKSPARKAPDNSSPAMRTRSPARKPAGNLPVPSPARVSNTPIKSVEETLASLARFRGSYERPPVSSTTAGVTPPRTSTPQYSLRSSNGGPTALKVVAAPVESPLKVSILPGRLQQLTRRQLILAVLVGFLLATLGTALYFQKKSGKSMDAWIKKIVRS